MKIEREAHSIWIGHNLGIMYGEPDSLEEIKYYGVCLGPWFFGFAQVLS